MRILRRRIVILSLLLLAPVLLLPTVTRIRQQNRRDDELFRIYDLDPLRVHGRDPDVYEADFDGDGTPGHTVIKNNGAAGTRLEVVDGGSELLTLPYEYIDNSLRTHFALTRNGSKSRLLVYDGTISPKTWAAFEWDGKRMIPVAPLAQESQFLTAMAAHDDSGTWIQRILFGLVFRWAIAAYYVCVALGVFIFFVYQRVHRNPAATSG